MTPTRFMVIAGEASGDLLAAELVDELRSGLAQRSTYSPTTQPLQSDLAPRFFGAGGPRMAAAGVELAVDMTQHSVVGLPVKHLPKLKRIFDQLFALAIEREPHVIILVDFSFFNGFFAAAIKRHVRTRQGTFYNWQPKLIKYISPQIWASREGRVHHIARDFDLLLSIFPFEKKWYAERVPELRVEFVGHPMIERYARAHDHTKIPESNDPENPLVVLLPGSRKSEVRRHFPLMLEAFAKIFSALPSARAVAILPNEMLGEMAALCLTPGFPGSALRIRVGGLSEELAHATIAISKTGTVTVECAYFGVPTVTLYKGSWGEYLIAKRMIKVKWLTMPNLLANEPVFPEFIQHDATVENISAAAIELLRHPERRTAIQARLRGIIASLGGPGASRRAAEAILSLVP